MAFELVCMMANWKFDCRGYALNLREIYEAGCETHEEPNSIFSDSDSDDE